jgi:hypothetical protein
MGKSYRELFFREVAHTRYENFTGKIDGLTVSPPLAELCVSQGGVISFCLFALASGLATRNPPPPIPFVVLFSHPIVAGRIFTKWHPPPRNARNYSLGQLLTALVQLLERRCPTFLYIGAHLTDGCGGAGAVWRLQ